MNFLVAPLAHADAADGQSYFEHAWVGVPDLIPRTEAGSNSVLGSVMPNWDSSKITSNGAGAIGTKALGIHGTSAASGSSAQDNRARKQALFCFLQNKYGLSAADRHSSCNGWTPTPNQATKDWEKMGAAFIVNQMLGKAWGTASSQNRTISSTQWSDLYSRLVLNDALTMSRGDFDPVRNTAGVIVGGKYDAVKWSYVGDGLADVDAWIFRVNGTYVYALELICANPLGEVPGLPSYKYSLTPSITSPTDGAVVNPGTSLTANGSVKNNGPDSAGTKTWYITRLRYDPNVNPNKSARDSNANGSDLCADFPNKSQCDDSNPKEQTFSSGQERAGSFSYTIPSNAAPGTKYCFVVSVRQPTQAATPVWRHSAMRCVTVASTADFDLIPKVDDSERSDGSAIEPGDSITVKHNVTNEGEDPSPQTIWQLTKLIYSPTAVFDNTPSNTTKKARDGNNNGDTACSMFMSAGRTECDKVQEVTDAVFNSGEPKTFDPVFAYDIPDDAPIGTRICFVSSVSKPTPAGNPVWRHSAMWCLMVGKKPKLQVWGGDVRSGGKINTSTSGFSGKTFGSWVEYGALSVGENKGFASGAALNKGSAMPGQELWSKLTFANTGGTFGVYSPSLPFTSLASQFIAPDSGELSGSHNLNDLASNRTPYKAGAITLSGTTISRGKTIIIDADTVTIQGDIAYEDVDYTNIRDLPQVIIKAKKINIESGVRRVDAWLLAVSDDEKGELNTCSNHTGNLTVSSCSNQLTINGPVVADIVYLRRTSGSENTLEARGEPAEIFNLRADAYMWANAYGLGTGRVQTVYSRELAPRL
jgi:hypothetical protein